MGKSSRGSRRTSRTRNLAGGASRSVPARPLMRKALPASLWLLGLAAGPFALGGGNAYAGTPPVGGIERTATPTGGTVVGGAGSITQKGLQTIIDQTSNKLALDWQTFNVGKDASVLFNQPSASAVALNRILDQNPSKIFGRIDSNGRVFLINTHGIIFGSTAQLNVGSLVASTLDLTPKDFLTDKFDFNLSGQRAGIVNHGTIQAASGGSVALLGGSVANDGLIVANYGSIHLDGADRAVLDFDGNGLLNIQITGELADRLHASEAAVDNKGRLRAEGGTVVLQAAAAKDLFTGLVNNSGVVDAGGISTEGGVVRLVASGGDTVNSGAINVSGTTGGSVELLSDRNVMVNGGSRIDASGSAGGGRVRVGGGYQGGEGLMRAERTYVSADAAVRADATQRGDGGSVVVWSDRNTVTGGQLSARGGAAGGNGGLVETSSHGGLTVGAAADVAAPAGAGGTWLLDPNDIEIVSGDGNTNISDTSPFESSDDTAQLGVDLIVAALTDGANVTVQTGNGGTNSEDGNITLSTDLDYDGTGDNSLTFDAANDILINSPILDSDTSSADVLDLSLLAGGSIVLDADVSLGAGSAILAATAGSITQTAGVLSAKNLDASAATGIGTAANPIQTRVDTLVFDNSTTGGVAVTNDGDLTVGGHNAGASPVTIVTDSGDLTIGADVDSGDEVSLVASSGNIVHAAGTVSASHLSLSAGGTNGSIGAGDVVLTDVGQLEFTANGTGAVELADANGAAISGTAGSGDVTVTSTTGDLAIGGDVTTTGDIELKALGGSIVSTDDAGTISGDTVTLAAGGTNGAVGAAGAILTDASSIVFAATGTGAVNIAEADGADVSGTAGSGNVAITSTTGDLAVVGSGIVTSGGTVALTAVEAGAEISVDSDAVVDTTDDGAATGGDVDLVADSMDIAGTVDAGTGRVGIRQSTAGREISLGGGTGPRLSLTGAELDRITADTIAIGDADSGDLTIANAIAPAAASNLELYTGGDISQDADATITVDTLSGSSGGATTLNEANHIGALGDFTAAGFELTNAAALTVGGALDADTDNVGLTTSAGTLAIGPGGSVSGADVELTGHDGVTLDGDVTATGDLALASTNAAITQAAGSTIAATGTTDVKAGTGAIDLAGAANTFGDAVSLETTGNAGIVASGALQLGESTVGGALDATAGGSVTQDGALDVTGTTTITVTAADSDVTLADTENMLADVAVGTEGSGSVGDFSLTNASTAPGSLTLATVGGDLALNYVNAVLTLSAMDVAGNLDVASGEGIVLGGDITTQGTQDYRGAVTLAAGTGSVKLDSSGANGDIHFHGTVDNADAATPQALTVDSGSGDATFDGRVGSTDAPGALGSVAINNSGDTTFADAVNAASLTTDANGSTHLGANVTTAGQQTYGDTLVLDGDVTLEGSQVALGSVTGAGNDLAITGNAVLDGALSGLASLDISGTTALNTTGVTTTGTQRYGGQVTLGDDTTLEASQVTLGGVTGAGNNLVITGNAVLDGALSGLASLDISGTTALNTAGVTTTGTQTYGGVVTLSGGTTLEGSQVTLGGVTGAGNDLAITGNAVLDGALSGLASLDISGTTALDTTGVTTTGTQRYGGQVTLGDDTTLEASQVTLGGVTGAGNGLAITGNAVLDGALSGLASLDISGTTALNTAGVTTTGTQRYGGKVTLSGGTTLEGSQVTLGGVTGAGHDLAIIGNAVLDGELSELASLAISGTTDLNTTGVTTTGTQNYGGEVTLGDDTTLSGSQVALGGVAGDTHDLAITGNAVFNGTLASLDDLSVSGTTTLNTTSVATAGTQSYDGVVTLSGGTSLEGSQVTLGGVAGAGNDLTIIGNAVLDGALSDLASLDISGTTALNTAGVTTTGTQNYGGQVTLGGGTTLSGSQVTLGGVTGAGNDLAITGNAVLDGELSGLASLDISGTTALNTAGVTTTGSQGYHGNVTLGQSVTELESTSGSIIFDGTVNAGDSGDGTLSVVANSGSVAFSGAVGDSGALNALVVKAGTFTAGSLAIGLGGLDIATSAGDISQTAAFTVAGTSSFDAGNNAINLGTTVNAFDGAVSLASGGGATIVNGGDLVFDTSNVGDYLLAESTEGGISQVSSSTLKVGGASVLFADNGSIDLGQSGNDFVGPVTATASGAGAGVSIADANALSIGGLYNGSNGAVELVAGGTLSLPTGAIDTGTADLTLISGGTLTLPGELRGYNITLQSQGDLTLDNALNGSGDGTVTLTSVDGNITQTTAGVITTVGGSLAGTSGGSTVLDQDNRVANLGEFITGGDFSFNNAQSLVVDQPIRANDGAGNITLTTTGAGSNLTLDTQIQGTDVVLQASGDIDQTENGTIEATTLSGQSGGGTTLDGPNMVDTLGSFATGGDFTFNNAKTLQVSGPLSANGGLGNIALATTDATSDLELATDIAAGNVTLRAGHDLELNAGNVTAGTAVLVAGGNVTQDSGIIDAGTLIGTVLGDVELTGANRIDTLGDFEADGFDLVNAQGLAVAGSLTATDIALKTTSGALQIGSDLAAGTIVLDSATDLGLSAALDATALTLRSGGNITQTASGLISAGTLGGHSAGDTVLDQANNVAALGAFDAANFTLVNAAALAVDGPVKTAGDSGDITLKTTAGALTVNSNLTGAAIALESAGDLALSRAVHGDTVRLDAGGNITQTASGLITAGTLSGHSDGDTVLDQANAVDVLGGFIADNFRLTSAHSLSVTGLATTGDAGDIALRTTSGALTIDTALKGNDIALTSAGNLQLTKALQGDLVTVKAGGDIGQTADGIITAGSLGGTSGGDTVLDQANRVGTLGVFQSGGNFSFNNAQTLTVNNAITANGGQGDITLGTTGAGSDLIVATAIKGDHVSLRAGRNISQTSAGTITAATLTGSSAGETALTGANHIGTLGSFNAAGFALANAQTLTVAGPVDGGASTALVTTQGDLAINGTVKGAATRLLSAGTISEGSKGVVSADTLSATAAGDVALDGANHVGSLSGASVGDFHMVNAQALDVGALVVGNGKALSLATSAGELTIGSALSAGSIVLKSATDLSLDKALQATSVSLTAGGDIAQGAGGSIDAHTLSGHSAGSTTLRGDNAIDTIGKFGADGFSLANGNSLAVAGPLDGGASTTLDVKGDLAIHGALSGKATTLRATGAISEGAKGTITAATLDGQSGGTTHLGGANRIDTLGGFRAVGFDLTNAKSLAVDGPLDGGASVKLRTTAGDLAIDGAVNGTTTTLVSAGAIDQGAGGNITAATLTGSSGGATRLAGNNHVDTLDAFSADGFSLHNAQALTVGGPLAGGSGVELATSAGDLAIDGALSGGKVVLVAAGAISEGADGTITATSLSGHAGGPTALGTSAHPIGNMVDTLGNFSSPAGFSMTNGKTLTLASIDGSAFTVDAGTAPVYLAVSNGDLLQVGTEWLYDGAGTFSAIGGHIGLGNAPIYIKGTSTQTVAAIGKAPAYFYAVDAAGNLLPLAGGFAVNVPTSSSASQAQNANGHGDSYIDPSVVTANYRSFGIVPTGILLPADQQAGCDPDDPDPLACE